MSISVETGSLTPGNYNVKVVLFDLDDDGNVISSSIFDFTINIVLENGAIPEFFIKSID